MQSHTVHDNKKVNAEPLKKARSERRPIDANMLTTPNGVISCLRPVTIKPNGVIKVEMEKLSRSNFGAAKSNGVIYSAVSNIQYYILIRRRKKIPPWSSDMEMLG